MYHCPVFSTSVRGGILFGPQGTYIFESNLRMDPDDNEIRWILSLTRTLTNESTSPPPDERAALPLVRLQWGMWLNELLYRR